MKINSFAFYQNRGITSRMNNLVIDIGNTNSKIAIFQYRELIHFEQTQHLDHNYLDKLIQKYKVQNSSISSVGIENSELSIFLSSKTYFKTFSTEITGKVKSHYQSQNTLGLDRWAKIIAAHCLHHGRNNLIIDAGTCITYDFLTEKDEYLGGNISLGIQMRFKALNYYTERLPLIEFNPENKFNDLGLTTHQAIEIGVLRGILNEIKGYINKETSRFEDLQIIFSGGDSIFLTKQLKNSIFAHQIIHEPYLVLKGLNEAITLKNE